ncbi:MAG: hypothetical protein HMLKMBBP_01777 [Planctomycetes bacterium]|nr:hypothetical protein [Planctomycetota bacterium]
MNDSSGTSSTTGADATNAVSGKMSPRAVAALSVAGASLFVLLCLGAAGGDVRSAVPASGFASTIARWLVTSLGAGAWVISVLGLAWGVIVYFQERTEDLVLRGVGTAVLAASTAMLGGLLHDGRQSAWAGELGAACARAVLSLGSLGAVLGWVAGLALFGVSLIFATDSLFNTLRRGRAPGSGLDIPTEPRTAELRGEDEAPEARAFVRAESRAVAIPTQETPLTAERPAPRRWEATETADGRVHLRGPTGYENVEFLPQNEEVAPPAEPEPPMPQEHVFGYAASGAGYLDDSIPAFEDDVIVREEAAETAVPAVAPAAEVPAEPAAPVPPVASADAESDFGSGIGYADDVILVDEPVFVQSVEVPRYASLGMPNDGASAADEIVRAYGEAPAGPAPASVAAAEEYVSVSDSILEDDLVVFGYDEVAADLPEGPIESAPATNPAPASLHEAIVSVVETAPTSDPAIESVVSAEPATQSVPAPEIWDFPAVAHESPDVEIPAAEVPAVESAAPFHAAADESEPREADTNEITQDVFADAQEAAHAVAAAAVEEAPVAAPAVEAPAVESPAVEAPAVEETPVAAAATESPAVEATISESSVVAPAAAPAAEPAPSTEQLRLFAPPACDLAALHTMELDPLFHGAVDAVLARSRASAVVLQRALGIGYARSLRLLDQMTTAGMLGPDAPGGAREIFFTRAQWDAFTSATA